MSELLLVAPVLPLFALGVVIAFRHPLWLLALYAAVVPFGSAVSLPLGLPPAFSTISTLIGLAAAVGVGAHVAVARNRAAWLQPAVPLLVMFYGLAVATAAWSVNRTATVSGVMILGSLVALYAVVGLMDPQEDHLTLLERAIVLGGAITGLYALLLLITGDLPSGAGGVPRFEVPAGGGEGGDPNITAASLLLPLFVGLGRGLRAPGVTERTLTLMSVTLLVMAVMLTGSRGAMVATVVGIAAISLSGLGRRGLVVALLPLLVGLLVFLSAPSELQDRLSKPTASGRSEILAIGLEACDRHCGTGSGWGSFPDVHEEILLETPWASGTRLRYVAHNIWLQSAVELGGLGLTLLGLAFLTTLASLVALPPQLRAPPIAALLALALTNTFLSNLGFKYFWLVFIYAAVVTQVHGRPWGASSTTRPRQRRSPARPTGHTDGLAATPAGGR